jgi:hypothetical protein
VAHLNVHRDGRWSVDPDTLGAAWRTLLRHLAGAAYATEALSVLDLYEPSIQPAAAWPPRTTS